jgi:hypothetical protein
MPIHQNVSIAAFGGPIVLVIESAIDSRRRSVSSQSGRRKDNSDSLRVSVPAMRLQRKRLRNVAAIASFILAK